MYLKSWLCLCSKIQAMQYASAPSRNRTLFQMQVAIP